MPETPTVQHTAVQALLRTSSVATNPVFNGLAEEELLALLARMERRSLQSGELLFADGDCAESLFVVEHGSLDVVKSDPGGRAHVIGQMGCGEIVGEMALIDPSPRSATIRANRPSELLELRFSDLAALVQSAASAPAIRERLVANLGRTLSRRLRERGEQALEMAQARLAAGQFLINAIVLFAVYGIVLRAADPLLRRVGGHESFISVPAGLLFAFGMYDFMRRSGYPRKEFGLTLEGAGRKALEGAGLSLPLMALVTLTKWWLLPAGEGHPLWGVQEVMARYSGPSELALFAALYSASVFVQEFAIRGAAQSGLMLFLMSRHRVVVAILVSNLIFAAGHLHLSAPIVLGSFAAGLYWGWIRERQGSLVGPIVCHGLSGLYVAFVLGWSLGG